MTFKCMTLNDVKVYYSVHYTDSTDSISTYTIQFSNTEMIIVVVIIHPFYFILFNTEMAIHFRARLLHVSKLSKCNRFLTFYNKCF